VFRRDFSSAVIRSGGGAPLMAPSVYIPPSGPQYYVDTNSIGGSASNSNPGTITQPWLTLQHGASQMLPGYTLNVRQGTYTGSSNVLDSNDFAFPGGTSGSPITIQAYNPGVQETVILQTPNGTNTIGLNSATQQYLVFQGLIIDGSLQSNINNQGIYISGGASQILVNLCSVRNFPNFGVAISNNNGVPSYITLFGMFIHGNGSGTSALNGHGIYNTGGAHVTVDTCSLYNNLGYGLQSYESDGNYAIQNCLYRNNTIYGNGRSTTTSYGIVCAGGQNNLVSNNVIYQNYGGVLIYSGERACVVACNTITNNQPGSGSGGIDAQFYGSSPTAINNVVYGNTSGINDLGGGTGSLVTTTNFLTNPAFVNPSGTPPNLQLQGTSGAIGFGTFLASVLVDSLGVTRANPPTCGAYEYPT
jgi:parallel beta-helix repeat protein